MRFPFRKSRSVLRFDRSLQGSSAARTILAAALFIALGGLWFPLTDVSASEFPPPQSIDQAPTDSGPSSESSSVLIGSLGRAFAEDAKYVFTSPLRIDTKSALILGGVAAAIGGLIVVDDDLQDFFQRNRNDFTRDISSGLDVFGSAPNVLFGNLGLIGAGWWFRESQGGDKLLRTALISLEAQAFTESIAGVTKFVVGRARPTARQGDQTYDPFHGIDRSFPSSHSARAFAVATVFADRYEQPVPILAYTLAALIGISRNELDRHWASDVFAGAALGFTMGKVLSWRHRHQDNRLTFLPSLPGVESSVGLVLQYSF